MRRCNATRWKATRQNTQTTTWRNRGGYSPVAGFMRLQDRCTNRRPPNSIVLAASVYSCRSGEELTQESRKKDCPFHWARNTPNMWILKPEALDKHLRVKISDKSFELHFDKSFIIFKFVKIKKSDSCEVFKYWECQVAPVLWSSIGRRNFRRALRLYAFVTSLFVLFTKKHYFLLHKCCHNCVLLLWLPDYLVGMILRREINNCDLHSPLSSVTFLSLLNVWRESLENWTPL